MDSDSETKPSRRTTRGRGRGRGRPPGRPPKKTKTPTKKKSEKTAKKDKDNKDKDVENEMKTWDQTHDSLLEPKPAIDVDDNIESELTSISFVTPTSKALLGNEPQNWKYKVNLIGEKVVNPRIHCCDKCLLPILVYGRMIPCKHVFCLSCGHQNDKQCPRCSEKVLRVEKTGLGTVFMCQTESCKRTYLSQRDLQAHIEHRHMRRQTSATALNSSNATNVITPPSNTSKEVSGSHPRTSSYASSFQSPIPVVSSRSNLITVPIQDEVSSGLSSISPNINQSTLLVSPSQSHSNYGVSQSTAYGHHNPHLQWSSIPPTTTYGYRPTPSWPPPPNPYNHPYNRYGYPQ